MATAAAPKYFEQLLGVLQSLLGLASLQALQKFLGKSSFPRTRRGVITGFRESFTSP